MHLYKPFFKLTILIFFAIFSIKTQAYVDKPVMVHLRISNQHDTFGFNLVQDLPDFIYKQLKNGSLALWDSPRKQTKLSFAALKEIEKSSKTNFADCSDIFIYEFWNCNKRSLSFVIAGFSFAYKNGEVFAPFGYVDAEEAFNLLARNSMPVNVNAPANVSYWEAINSKRYNFTIVQYGKHTLNKNDSQAAQVKAKVFNGKRKLIPSIDWPETKLVAYEMINNLTLEKDWSIDTKKGLEELFNKDKNLVYQHGGNAYFDTGNYRGYFAITGIQIFETWQKRGNLVFYYIDSVVFYVNNKKLTAFSSDEIENLNITIRFKTIADILKEKEFKIAITEINRINIDPKEKEAYLKALENYKWTQISQYVKYVNAE